MKTLIKSLLVLSILFSSAVTFADKNSDADIKDIASKEVVRFSSEHYEADAWEWFAVDERTIIYKTEEDHKKLWKLYSDDLILETKRYHFVNVFVDDCVIHSFLVSVDKKSLEARVLMSYDPDRYN